MENFYVVGNPPFLKDIHLQFLQKMFYLEQVKKIVFVHPGAWLLDEKPNEYKLKTRTIIEPHFKSAEFVNGNYYFDALFYAPCVISEIDKREIFKSHKVDYPNGSSVLYDDLRGVNQFASNDTYFNIKSKIDALASSDNLKSFAYRFNDYGIELTGKKSKNYWISINRVSGRDAIGSTEMFHPLIGASVTKSQEITSDCNKRKDLLHYSFDTIKEAENFISYCRSPIVQYMIRTYKVGPDLTHREMKFVPTVDFTVEPTESFIKESLGLTESELNFINSSITDSYNYSVPKNIETKCPSLIKMNLNKERQNETAEVFTPSELVNKLLERFTEEDFKNPDIKWLDPTCGDGAILQGIYNKLIQYHNHDYIVNTMLYGADIMKDNVESTIDRLNINKEHVVECDGLAWDYEFENSLFSW